jgi:3'-5' exoribonuclease
VPTKPIKQLSAGDHVVGFFVIRKKALRTKKADGSPFLALEFGDASGRISAAIWEDVSQQDRTLAVGDIVKVQGTVYQYRESLSLHIEKIRKARPEDGVSPDTFLPGSSRNLKKLEDKFRWLLDSVEEPYLNQLLHAVFSSPFLEDFCKAPGGKLWHHNRVGGLLEHTLGVAEICLKAAEQYPAVSRDLLLAGALLHDIGKVDSYGTDKGFIEYTDQGRLLGHIVIGYRRVENAVERIPDFPEELRKQILHLILSHQGELEKGSPVVPMTLEAILLYYADEMDSKADAFQRIMRGEKEPGKKWSQFVHLLDRFIYFGESKIEEKSDNQVRNGH